MRILKILSVLVVFSFITSCAYEEPIKYSDYSYHKLPKYNFNVKKIIIESNYSSPITYPNVEHLAPISLERAFRDWVKYNVTETGKGNATLKIIINDASMKEKTLETEKSFTSKFKYEQNREYTARLDIHFHIYEGDDITPKTLMEISVVRSRTGNNEDAPAQKERLFYELTQKMLIDTTAQIEENIYNYLSNYLN
ncbi:MAG: hypothetical protein J0H68_08245 [Sphingobacteriia bacterium]|nr:hypothetical protein [Sphingobacteriia bacterium]